MPSLSTMSVFSVGVGTSVNRYLMEHMAKLGNGAVAYIGLQDRNEGSDVMAAYFERISHPALVVAVARGAPSRHPRAPPPAATPAEVEAVLKGL